MQGNFKYCDLVVYILIRVIKIDKVLKKYVN